MTTTPERIRDFWLNEVGPGGWYAATPALDARVRQHFLAIWEEVAAHGLPEGWPGDAEGALAALILTDQFPRNMFRGDPRAYATDAQARDLARAALAAGHDLAVDGPARQFFYMPFMHSEDLADQDQAVALFDARLLGDNQRHARLHRDVIACFGRFPWRNADLGRTSTDDEQALLAAGGYGALLRGTVSLDAKRDIV